MKNNVFARRKFGKYQLYFILYCLIVCLATLLLRPYQLKTKEYIDTILYFQLDIMLTFPLFMAVFVVLKLTTFIMLGNLITDAFVSGNTILLIRYGVLKYFILQVIKVTSAIIVTILSSVFFWCIISSAWSFSILKIMSYIMLMSCCVLLLNLIHCYMNYYFINILSAILLCSTFYISGLIKHMPAHIEFHGRIFFLILLLLFSIINAILIRYIRKMNFF
jgi:hypothetical protein